METPKTISRITNVAFKGIAVAMGIAVIVLNMLGTLTVNNALALLGLGLAALAVSSFQKPE